MDEEYRTPMDYLREGEEALAPYAMAIGRLCMTWAELERTVVDLCATLLRAFDDERTFTMIQCVDFRDQLSMLKVGAVAAMDKERADVLIASVDYIDAVLRLRRNRYVHDRWDWHYRDGVARVDPTPKTYKAPGSGERMWRTYGVEHEPVSVITETTKAVFNELALLCELTAIVAGHSPTTLEELIAEQPQRLLAVPPQGTPHRRDSVG